MPLVIRVLAVVFVFSTIFDSFTFSFLNKSDNLAQLVGLVLAIVFVALRAARLRFPDVDSRWLLVFFVITGLEEGIRYATLGSGLAAFSLRNYISYLQVFILYVIIRDISKDPRVFRGIVTVFFVTYFGASLLTRFGLSMVTAEAGGRVGLVGVNLNSCAFSLAVIIVGIVAWILFWWPRLGWKGVFLLGSLVPLLVTIAGTGSRGGSVALVLGILAAILINVRAKRVPGYMILVPLVLAGVFFVLMSSDVLEQRVQRTLRDRDYGSRAELVDASMPLLKKAPLIGPGPGYALALGQATGTRKIAAHNTYLQVLLAFGLLGAIPFFLALLFLGFRLWRVRDGLWASVALAVACVMLVDGLSLHLAYSKSFWIILALVSNAHLMPAGNLALRDRVRRRHSPEGLRPGR